MSNTNAAFSSPASRPWLTAAVACAAGALFALGLVVSGMTQPAKVLGFLDIAALVSAIQVGSFPGDWDPSLGFVMAGAVAVTWFAFATTGPQQGRSPWLARRFELPDQQQIDRPLVLGAVVFGIGWGLSGYCPGPALASALSGSWGMAAFLPAMLAGMWFAKKSR